MILVISISASAQMNLVGQFGQLLDTAAYLLPYKTAIGTKQATISGTGLARFSGNAVTFDANVYLTANQSISVGVTGGDITSVATASGTAPSVALTLATVNSNTTALGSASTSVTIQANAKGLVTSVVSNAIQIAESAVTGLVSDIASKQGTLTITNTGTGASSISGNTINIPVPISAANVQRNDESTGLTSTSVTLLHTPLSSTLTLYKNGVKLPAAKFSFTGTTVTLTTAAVAADTYSSDYNY